MENQSNKVREETRKRNEKPMVETVTHVFYYIAVSIEAVL